MKYLLALIPALLSLAVLIEPTIGQMQSRQESISEVAPVQVRDSGTWRRGRRIERLKERLGLNDDQVKKIREIRRDARKQFIRLRAELRVARLELGELVTGENIDRARIDAKLDEIGNLRQQHLKLRTDMVLKTRHILTPEQWAQADGWFTRFLSGRRRPRDRWRR